MKLEQRDEVQVLTLDEAHQVFNDHTLDAFEEALDAVEAVEGPTALVIAGRGKSFHQGLDLPYVQGLGEGFTDFIKRVHALFARLYSLDMATVAAVNGHAIAGGAMLAQCADLRIMRADRGWFRLPEVELGLPFSVVMDALLQARLPQPARHRLMVLGEQLGGARAAEVGAVDAAVDGEAPVVEAAIAHAAGLTRFRGPVLQTIRASTYRELMAAFAADADRTDVMVP